MQVRFVLAIQFLLLLSLPTGAQTPEPGKAFRDCPECPEMVVVPPGTYRMGLPRSMRSERIDIEGPQHDVSIGYAFAVGRFEVTVGQFAAFVKEAGYANPASSGCGVLNQELLWEFDAARGWRDPGYAQSDAHPVVCVSWQDAKAYVDWLSRKTGMRYRLLSESEWEYVARAGSRALRPWEGSDAEACKHGNVWDSTFEKVKGYPRQPDRGISAPGVGIGGLGIQERSQSNLQSGLGQWYRDTHWCSDGHALAAPVGQFAANGFGLHDMIGNAWEWVEDCVNTTYTGAPADGSAWQTGNCDRRVARGASWTSIPRDTRFIHRSFRGQSSRNFDLGFRVARTL